MQIRTRPPNNPERLVKLIMTPRTEAEKVAATPLVEGPARPREHGLDTLRAAAISLVFMYHYMSFVSNAPTFGFLSVIGWTGVDLFFVLSGYLIANQIFAGVVRDQTLSLKNFYARRALRTLPVYWLILAMYSLFPDVMGGNPPPPLWRFLTFTQNWGLHGGTAFSHAWSLCPHGAATYPEALRLDSWMA